MADVPGRAAEVADDERGRKVTRPRLAAAPCPRYGGGAGTVRRRAGTRPARRYNTTGMADTGG
ncbi:MAG TPA: hypothetical protein VH478_19300 [Trebonia sp.]|jgi:hypothetical protein|nr:hypothetical protein [Trebonia sp.]